VEVETIVSCVTDVLKQVIGRAFPRRCAGGGKKREDASAVGVDLVVDEIVGTRGDY
jgi:hypothetical protein